MGKLKHLVTIMLFVMVISSAAGAASFEADGSYLIQVGQGEIEKHGALVNATVEIYPNLLADGSFLISGPFGSVEDALGEKSERLVTVGGLYRVVSDSDLQVLVGGGLADFSGPADREGRGFFGKFRLKFQTHPKVILLAELNYAPKFKTDGQEGTLLDARATAGYQLLHDLGLQGSIKHYKLSGSEEIARTFFGGGVVLSF